MWSAPNATRCHIDLARIGLGIIDELRNRLGWNRGMNHHDVDRAQQACDRFNIMNEIEIKLCIERRVNRVRRRDEKECVASPGALTTASVPILLPAPGRFSTMNC